MCADLALVAQPRRADLISSNEGVAREMKEAEARSKCNTFGSVDIKYQLQKSFAGGSTSVLTEESVRSSTRKI
ncbi:hypothetical protein KIN20_016256 [Parelaphostrongylus tenuis]|uniref:Uncharacterized protein n=1 Tax=Parelaphostrongylus tenuis TaxID=148309 RepID=A0AAD5QMU9_PARTN|nr:hypothetical protein KIN20_016256 [Parelaphostrongylus tenuis]